MSEIPRAPVRRLLKSASNMRVGEDAANHLREANEDYMMKVGQKAADFADNAGRKTVKQQDIELAMENVE